MDRSFLSDPQIIEQSRNFVCIRLATFEDKIEANFLQEVYSADGSRTLANTVFAILAPDGQERLSRAHRAPNQVYGSPRNMVTAMKKIAAAYPAKASEKTRLPQMKDFRLALNVASCDGVPLMVGFSEQKAKLAELENTLAKLAFSRELAGKLHFYSTSDPAELKSIKAFEGESGYYFIGPNQFGDEANVAELVPAETKPELVAEFLVGFTSFLGKVEKDHRSHVREGLEKGVDWQTEVPVTDREAVRAKERADGQRKKQSP